MKCVNCGAELAPEHRFCEVCGTVRPPFPQRIAESEREFEILRNRHQSGQLSDAALAEELKKLVVHEEDSGYWMLGARTGRWYWFDGQQWVPRQPPVAATAAAPAPVQTVVTPPVQPLVTVSTAGPATSLEQAISRETTTTTVVTTTPVVPPPPVPVVTTSVVLPYLQRMLFVAAAGTLGAFLGILMAYIVGFFCRADTPARQLSCLVMEFGFFGAGLGLALGLGCGLLLGGDARGAGLGILLGGIGGITGGILLMATRLTLLRTGQGVEEASPGVLAQALPLLVYGLALALMVGLLPGFLVRSPSRAIAGVIGCGVAVVIVFFLVLMMQGAGHRFAGPEPVDRLAPRGERDPVAAGRSGLARAALWLAAWRGAGLRSGGLSGHTLVGYDKARIVLCVQSTMHALLFFLVAGPWA